jgi:hypothetical protein
MSEEFRVTEWLSAGVKGVKSKLHVPTWNPLPDTFRDHLRTSRKEVLLAFRSLFDTAIDRIDASESRRGRKIKAE